MFRLFVLSLCMGCTGLAQQIPSCRIAIPVSLAGREGAALAREYRPRDLRVRVGNKAVGGDLTAARPDRLVILLDGRESMRPFWPAAIQSVNEILAQFDSLEQVSLLLVGDTLRETHGLSSARQLLEESRSADRLTGSMSIYSAIVEATANLHGAGDAVVLLTSGLETVGKPQMNAVRSLLVERGVRVNAVMILSQGRAAIDVLLGPHDLEELAHRTGGSVTVVKPRDKSSRRLLPDNYVSRKLAYSSLELSVPGGTRPHRLSISWSRYDTDGLPQFVAPPRIGPCPATLSAKAQ